MRESQFENVEIGGGEAQQAAQAPGKIPVFRKKVVVEPQYDPKQCKPQDLTVIKLINAGRKSVSGWSANTLSSRYAGSTVDAGRCRTGIGRRQGAFWSGLPAAAQRTNLLMGIGRKPRRRRCRQRFPDCRITRSSGSSRRAIRQGEKRCIQDSRAEANRAAPGLGRLQVSSGGVNRCPLT